MSNQMRKLIDLVEEAQINQYLDRLQNAKTQEEFESIINEAKLIEAPGMVDKIKKGAMAGALGLGLSMGAMADEPASADPGADVNKSQAVQSVQSIHPSYGQLDTPATEYTTTKHHKVASDIIKMMYDSAKFERDEYEKLLQKDYEYRQNDTKVDMGMGWYKTPFTQALRLKKNTSNQAKYDLKATRYVLTNPRFIERYAGNPDRAKGNIAPGNGEKAGIAALKLYLERSKSFEAPGSAGRNVPQ